MCRLWTSRVGDEQYRSSESEADEHRYRIERFRISRCHCFNQGRLVRRLEPHSRRCLTEALSCKYSLLYILNSPTHCIQDFPGIFTCSVQDSMSTIYDTIRKSRVHRFIVIDDDTKLRGVLTLSDVLEFTLLEGVDDE